LRSSSLRTVVSLSLSLSLCHTAAAFADFHRNECTDRCRERTPESFNEAISRPARSINHNLSRIYFSIARIMVTRYSFLFPHCLSLSLSLSLSRVVWLVSRWDYLKICSLWKFMQSIAAKVRETRRGVPFHTRRSARARARRVGLGFQLLISEDVRERNYVRQCTADSRSRRLGTGLSGRARVRVSQPSRCRDVPSFSSTADSP